MTSRSPRRAALALALVALALPTAATAQAQLPDGLKDGPDGSGALTERDVAWLSTWAERLSEDDAGMVRGLADVARACRAGAPLPGEVRDVLQETLAGSRAAWARYDGGVDDLLARAVAARRAEDGLRDRSRLARIVGRLAELGDRVARHRVDLAFVADDLPLLVEPPCSGTLTGGIDDVERRLRDDLRALGNLVADR